MLKNKIKEMIELSLPDATVIIEGDDGKHFNAIIVSDEFIENSRLNRQRLVLNALGKNIEDGTIHAISFKTYTFDEWNNK